jgi:hypothetical protein
MRNRSVVASVMVLGLLALGATACSSSGPSISAKKMAFCSANDSIDRASTNVNSNAGFLAVLKTHQGNLNTMESNAPSGSVGQLARSLVNAAHTAIRTNSINPITSIDGGPVDTYCGVDGNGNPLPSYFAAGKGTAFCSTFLPIYQAVIAAQTSQATLAALVANRAQIAQLATEVSGLPASIMAKASQTVTTAQSAIQENSAAPLQGNGNGPAMSVALYCGQNQ